MTMLILSGVARTLARYGLQALMQYRTGPGFPNEPLTD